MIIGRTLVDSEIKFKDKKLTKFIYYKISRISRQILLDNEIFELPLNLNQILKKNNIKHCSYENAPMLFKEHFSEAFKENAGFTYIDNENSKIIFYDSTLPVQVQRFTIAHELGHIFLGHTTISDNNEQEANMFAARLLMPMCVIYECHIKSAEELSACCNVSIVSAKFRFKRFKEIIKRNKFYTDKTEIYLREKFSEFIDKYNNTQK